MNLTNHNREIIERALDDVSLILTRMQNFPSTYQQVLYPARDIDAALNGIAASLKFVRELPPGYRRIRKDAGQERTSLTPRVTPV